ncbi:MAG TPA: hypothetical protein DCG53_05920 [Syntrophus sp. (in: bacteria)]|nr:hypothetical protein [Syntrophus sp. (in: bacteria)]
MPIYEYECATCGKVSEYLEGINSEEEEARCRFCGGADLRRLMSPSALPRSGPVIGSQGGKTCCGRAERCDVPPCSSGGGCGR